MQPKSNEDILAVLMPMGKESTPIKMLEIIFVEKRLVVPICITTDRFSIVTICVPANEILFTFWVLLHFVKFEIANLQKTNEDAK